MKKTIEAKRLEEMIAELRQDIAIEKERIAKDKKIYEGTENTLVYTGEEFREATSKAYINGVLWAIKNFEIII